MQTDWLICETITAGAKPFGEKVMCLITEHAKLKKKVKELEETLAEYHEIIETGWDYPDVTLRLPKSRDIIPYGDIGKEPQDSGKYRLTVENLPDFWIANVADTLSEDPFYGQGHNIVLAKLPQSYAPYRYEDLAVGDSAVYQVGDRLISHQIIKVETDTLGRKYTFRGRNTATHDPYVVRNWHIKYLSVAVVF